MFNEFKLNNKVTLRNKIVVAPMTTWSSEDDLTIAEDEAFYYAKRSKDAGMVITACTFFSPEGQGFANQFYAGRDEFIPSLKKLADSIKKGGSKAILQIFHAGRMADPSKGELVSASAIKATHNLFGPVENMETPRELTHEEIEKLIQGFHDTTERAIKAGFDGIEIHGANTYLIQQFFSPHSNRREDEWGGTREKRMKFAKEIIRAVNRAKKESADESFIIGYRFSPEEMEEPGITLDDTLYLVDTLCQEDIDYLHISLSDYKKSSIRDEKDTRAVGQIISEKIKGRKPFIGVGSIYTKENAEDALQNYGYDIIALGHAIVTDPDWIKKIKSDEIPEIAIDMDNLKQQAIPAKMANAINNVPGWFKIKKSMTV